MQVIASSYIQYKFFNNFQQEFIIKIHIIIKIILRKELMLFVNIVLH